jgi:hypothetical protein
MQKKHLFYWYNWLYDEEQQQQEEGHALGFGV